MTAVHQFHPVLAFGDAMSDHVFALRADRQVTATYLGVGG